MKRLLLLSLLLNSLSLFTQDFEGNLYLENITLADGYQFPYVYEVTQDTTGRMWFLSRSHSRLSTYQGTHLDLLDKKDLELPASLFYQMLPHPQSPDVYFTFDSITAFDPFAMRPTGGIKPIPWPASRPSGPKMMTAAARGAKGIVWMLYAPDPDAPFQYVLLYKDGAVKKIDSLQVDWYYDRSLVRGEDFFLKLRDKVLCYTPAGQKQSYEFPAGTDPVMPAITLDTDNTVWVVHSPELSADAYGVYFMKEGSQTFERLSMDKRFPQESTFGQIFAEGDYLWHRGYPFSLSRMRISDGRVEDFSDKIIDQQHHFPFFNSNLLNLYRGHSGEIWLTTRAGMVKMLVEDQFQVFLLAKEGEDCLEDTCLIKAMTEDEAGNLYASHTRGIEVWNSAGGRKRSLNLNIPPQTRATHSLSYARGRLFWNNYEIDLETGRSRHLLPNTNESYTVHAVSPDSTQLWMANNEYPISLFVYDFEAGDVKQLELPDSVLYRKNSEVRQIHVSPTSQTVFLAIHMEGLLELNLQGKVLNQYNHIRFPKRWNSNSMYCLHEDDRGQLWYGHGSEAGLSKMDLISRTMTEYPYQIDLSIGSLKRVFHMLAEGKNHLWLVTEKGTLRLDKNTGKLSRFPMFPALSEMAYPKLPAFASKTGKLYIGTPIGKVHAFQPDKLIQQAGLDKTYPIVISQFRRFDSQQDSLFVQHADLAALSDIELSHQDRYFELEVFIGDYRRPSHNRFSWWLEGYENEWSIPSKDNTLRYENLPAGEYSLHIKGGLSPEYYASSERCFSIVVKKAWYLNNWAIGMYLLVFLGLSWLFYRFQVRRQLIRAERQREQELARFKSRLYTNVTHEFRTPLTVIMGMASQIKGHAHIRELIERNSQNLLRLVNQLLDLSKIESHTLKLAWVHGNIIPYLEYLTESFYSLAEEKKIRLTFYPEDKEVLMDFDEEKIQHVVYNLLSNALKFTEEGGKVKLHAHRLEASPEALLELKVSDTGIGMMPAEQHRIFDRFYQADPSSTRRREGSGIGLSLTQDFVEMMGGSISVESQIGIGSIFSLRLPIRNAPDIPSQEQQAVLGETKPQRKKKAVPILIDPTTTPKPIVLLIEDNLDVSSYIRSILHLSYEVVLAQNGHLGIEKALELVPDLIISDVMMPEKNGYEVCATLKEDERSSHIPIILLTARAQTEDRIEGLRGGADAYLTKPFHKEELLIRLEKLLALRQELQARYADPNFFKPKSRPEPVLDPETLFLNKLHQVVADRLDDPKLSVADLCEVASLSNMQVNRKLKALTGRTPSDFIRYIRLNKARELLQQSEQNVSEIAYGVGFSDPNYFSRAFSKEFGYPPSELRK